MPSSRPHHQARRSYLTRKQSSLLQRTARRLIASLSDFAVTMYTCSTNSKTFISKLPYLFRLLRKLTHIQRSAIESPTKKPRRTEIVVPVEHRNASPPPSSPNPSKAHAAQSPQSLSAAASRSPTPTHTGPLPSTSTNAGTAHYPSQTSPMGTPLLRSRSSTKGKAAAVLADLASPSSQSPTPPPPSSTPPYAHGEQMKRKKVFHPSSAVSLTPYTTLVYHAVTEGLALVALLPTSVWEGKRGLVEFNIVYFRCASSSFDLYSFFLADSMGLGRVCKRYMTLNRRRGGRSRRTILIHLRKSNGPSPSLKVDHNNHCVAVKLLAFDYSTNTLVSVILTYRPS